MPVNLRQFFPSKTLRNFITMVYPAIDPRMGDYSLEEVLRLVHHQLGADLNEKEMRARITTNVRSEKSIFVKIVPLFFKNLIMKFVYTMVGERKSCISVSNLGAIVLPEEMKRYVNRIDFILGVQAVCHYNCGVLSYGDQLMINLIRNTEDSTLEREFFTRLRKLGLHVKIESNQR